VNKCDQIGRILGSLGQFFKTDISSPKFWATVFQSIDYVLILTKKMVRRFWERFFTNSLGHPGTDVMITIFCDFCQFSAKKLAFISKAKVMINFLHNLAMF
jgi:hypothetical protein